MSLIKFESNFNFYQNMLVCIFPHSSPITTKFCTYQDSSAVLVCAKFCCDWIFYFCIIPIRISIKFENQLESVSGIETWSILIVTAILYTELHLQDLLPYSTPWGQDKMATIFQTTFWNAFSWMKMYQFQLKFHWSLFLIVRLTIFHDWFR